MSARWLDEPLADGMRRLWRLDEVLWEGSTPFQRMMIARTAAQGIGLFCDDERQSIEFSQLVYHEALLVPALLLASRLERVLIIGSSEGVASQLALAAGARIVDHVDIDRECVRRCAELLPYGYTVDELAAAERGAGPVRLHYADGWDFVSTATGEYDIVVIDLPDERIDADVQHNRLYGVEFLQRCAALLAPGGVVASQAGCPTLWRNASLVRSWQRFCSVFQTVAYYGSDEHEWAFLFGRPDMVADPVSVMVERLPSCRYQPVNIDAAALVGCSIPPLSVRSQVSS